MMHVLTHRPKPLQWLFAFLLAALCIAIVGLCFVLRLFDWRWLPLPLIAIFLTAPLESLLLRTGSGLPP